MSEDLWTYARSPEWRYTLLDSSDRPLGGLLGVLGGQVEIVSLSRLGGSLTLQITQTNQEIDWMNDRVSVEYDPGIPGLAPIPWGVWLFSSPKLSFDMVQRNEVVLLPKTVVIDEDTVVDTFSVAEGTPIIPLVASIIESTGETRIAVTSSDATTTNAVVFEPGESKLTIINTLLESAGYEALWVDGSGQFRVEPYVRPGDRVIRRTFEAGDWSIHKPGWMREQELSGVPNRVIVVSEGTDDEPAIVGLAENNDPESPFSIPSRDGRVITRREDASDISSQAEADALAERYLIGAMSPVANIEVAHAIVPLDPGDRVRFIDGNPEVERDATVQRMAMPLEPFAQCDAVWREV